MEGLAMKQVRYSIFLILSIFLASCGGSDSSSPVVVTGKLSASDYAIASNQHFQRLWALLFEPIAVASSTTVNKIWAIPLYNGEFHPTVFNYVKEITPNSDGSFSIGLDQKGWVLILLDTNQAARKDQVVGYVTMTAGSNGLTALPLSGASGTVDFGDLSKSGDETTSTKDNDDNAAPISITSDQLLALALSDNGIKTVKNAYRNYDGTTFTSIKPFFTWGKSSGASADILDTYTSVSDMVSNRFNGYLFYMNSNHSAINYTNICAQSTGMTLYPPSSVTNIGNTATFTTSIPISSLGGSASTNGNSCTANQLYLRDDTATYGSYQFNFSAGATGGANDYLSPPIPSGDWTLKVGSTTIAEFEGNVGSIFLNDNTTKPIVILPSIKATTSGGNITRVDVRWYVKDNDAGTFSEVTDTTLLGQLKSVSIFLTDYNSSPYASESVSCDSASGCTLTPSARTWSSSTANTSISVSYTVNNIAIYIDYRL